ncbi:MAG: hypothetical protein AAGG81_02280 [Chlamydiota bacterium]
MDKFLETFSIAAVLIVIALVMIGLSWVLTGKQKIKGGTCGRDPTKEQDKSCGTKVSCTLCDKGSKEGEETETKEKENE